MALNSTPSTLAVLEHVTPYLGYERHTERSQVSTNSKAIQNSTRVELEKLCFVSNHSKLWILEKHESY